MVVGKCMAPSSRYKAGSSEAKELISEMLSNSGEDATVEQDSK